jgi:uncharacterized delta-60 repeat protein
MQLDTENEYIYLAGFTIDYGNQYFAIVRYTYNGILDTSFGPINSDGIVVTDLGGKDQANTMQLDTVNNYIYLGGYTDTSSDGQDFALVRYKADGELDTQFGDNGIVTTDIDGNNTNIARSIQLDTDNNYIYLGGYTDASDTDFALVRYKNIIGKTLRTEKLPVSNLLGIIHN